MKKAWKWIGILVVVAMLGAAQFVYTANGHCVDRLAQHFVVTPPTLALPSDSAALARGEHLAHVLCTNCHGNSFEGFAVFNDLDLVVINTPNITAGKGGVTAHYTAADRVRVVWDHRKVCGLVGVAIRATYQAPRSGVIRS